MPPKCLRLYTVYEYKSGLPCPLCIVSVWRQKSDAMFEKSFEKKIYIILYTFNAAHALTHARYEKQTVAKRSCIINDGRKTVGTYKKKLYFSSDWPRNNKRDTHTHTCINTHTYNTRTPKWWNTILYNALFTGPLVKGCPHPLQDIRGRGKTHEGSRGNRSAATAHLSPLALITQLRAPHVRIHRSRSETSNNINTLLLQYVQTVGTMHYSYTHF